MCYTCDKSQIIIEFITKMDKGASTMPEDIQKCIRAGVLTSCYENTAIEVEVQEQSVMSCFTLNKNGTVTCPVENTLTKRGMKGKNSIYCSKDTCRQCPNRCTSSSKPREVSFGPDTRYIPTRMYGSVTRRLNPIPADILINPFNHTLD